MPTLKLVLMALADAADDHGVCWPSVSTLAKKCTVSTRTVSKLEYPKGLSPSERADAQRRLSRLSPEIAQQLLDELAARLKAGTIRISPLVYLVGLIKRANAGKFVPEAALQVADARQKRRRNEGQMQRLQALNDQPMPDKTDVADCPLAKRIAEIRFRNRGRGEDGGSTCD